MMKPATSFRQTFAHIPSRYRTPSPPPPEAIEPLSPCREGAYSNWLPEKVTHDAHGLGLSLDTFSNSPGAFSYDSKLWVDGDGQARIESFHSNAFKTNPTRTVTQDDYEASVQREGGSHGRGRKGHARSGSNIDTLATIALATSPTFSQGSPSLPQNPWSATTQWNESQRDYTIDERPSKRARSEKPPSPQTIRQHSRPATSHVASLQSLKDDAELLLNFAQPHNFRLIATSTPPQPPRMEQGSPHEQAASSAEAASELVHALPPSGGLMIDSTIDASHDILIAREDAATQPRERKSADKAETSTLSSSNNRSLSTATTAPKHEGTKARRIKPTTQAPCPKCNSAQALVETIERDGMTSWIECDNCSRWFHAVCSGFKDGRETRVVDKYICSDCEPLKGRTTFVRTSSRARTAIDYAGLHQGMIRSSEDTAEHHWIKPIKDGRIKFQPDDFARMRPELLTMDYLEKTDGLKRPTVIPACWNPQHGRKHADAESREETTGVFNVAEVTVDGEGEPVILPDEHPGSNGEEEIVDCGQDLLDMVMPENLTVRQVAELHGPDMPLDVIDVKSQQTAQRWNLKKWADYYESTGDKTIRNVISLEVSQSKLGRLLRRPKIVRDLDLQDDVWPADLPSKAVQFYCLMSVADCYTDFHIDFGGSSVYYHILKGKKTFFFIPPEDRHLKKYEQWNNSPLQNQTFLGTVTGDCSRVDLVEGDTMLIPSGWIHAVWTPENSLVIGGNFLTRMSYEMQIKINRVEIDTKTALKFRYPQFQKVNWYAAIRYVEDDPVPDEVVHEFEDDPDHVFLRANPVWHEFGDLETGAEPGEPFYNVRFYSRMEIEGLPALRDYLYRTALIASDFHVEGINESTRANVKKSVPKGHGEPMDIIRRFGIWVAWKTGCVTAADWVRPGSPSLAKLAPTSEKQKKFDVRPLGERTSSRVQAQLQHAGVDAADTPVKREAPSDEPEGGKDDVKRPKKTPKTSGLGPQRFACDTCRKRRIRCRHKESKVVAVVADTGRLETHSSPSLQTPQSLPANSSTLVVNVSPLSSPSVTKAPLQVADTPRQDPMTISLPEVNGLNGQHTPLSTQRQHSSTNGGSSNKKGRSKACEECRKSKRRCIHNENGQIDPSKAAEPSKPRSSTSIKRPARLSDGIYPVAKRIKVTSPVGQGRSPIEDVAHDLVLEQDETDLMVDPSVHSTTPPRAMGQFTDDVGEIASLDPKTEDTKMESAVDIPARVNHLTIQTEANRYQSPPPVKFEAPSTVVAALATSSSQISANSLVSPPDSLHNRGETLSPAEDRQRSLGHGENGDDGQRSSSKGSSTSASTSTSLANRLQTPQSAGSRHSSRQPKRVDRYVPESALAVNLDSPEHKTAKQQTGANNYHGSSVKTDNRRRSSGATAAATATARASSKQPAGVVVSKAKRAAPEFHQRSPPQAATSGEKRVEKGEEHDEKPTQLESHANGDAKPHPESGSAVAVGLGVANDEGDKETLELARALRDEQFGLRRRGGQTK